MSIAVSTNTVEALSLLTTPEQFKKEILKRLGTLPEVDVMFNSILLVTYIRPEKRAGSGIIRPFSNVQEDVFQGKAGLVVKIGPNAFKDDEEAKFYGQNVEIGDWVVFRVGDAWPVDIKGVPCRLVRDSSIRMKVTDPMVVF